LRRDKKSAAETQTAAALSLTGAFPHHCLFLTLCSAPLETLLRQRRHVRPGATDDFQLRNMAEFIRTRSETQNILSLLLGATAAISLIVGGIGIMNIMLVSVTERTKEIGLRMAVGARRRDILSQFLIEAVTLCLTGGLIGLVIGASSAPALANCGVWPIAFRRRSCSLPSPPRRRSACSSTTTRRAAPR
jgi:FtsX-like permease family